MLSPIIDILQLLSFFFSVITIIILSVWSIKHRRRRLYTVPMITWLLHAAVFYFFRSVLHYTNPDYPVLYSTWSAFVRFHAIATCFFSTIILTDTVDNTVSWIKNKWNSHN